MSRWLRERGRPCGAPVVAIDRQRLAWVERNDSSAQTVTSCDYRDGVEPALGEAMRRARATLPASSTVEVIAGNDLAVYWVQTPPAALASFGELRRIAQARCAHLYGGLPEDWRVAGDWDAHHPFVCTALPRAVVGVLEQEFVQRKLVPRWHTAWGMASGGLASAFPAVGWSAMRTPNRMVLWHCLEGRVDCLASLATDSTDDAARLAAKARQRIQIEISRAERTAGDVLHWLDLAAEPLSPISPAGTTGIVAVQPHPLTGPWPSAPRTEAAAALALQALVQGGAA